MSEEVHVVVRYYIMATVSDCIKPPIYRGERDWACHPSSSGEVSYHREPASGQPRISQEFVPSRQSRT